MGLIDLWATSRGQLETKQLHQIIAIAGEGRLADGNVTCNEFRELLAHVGSPHLIRFADEALVGKFDGSGFALQDIVNEIGKRLGFSVEHGRYRGTHGQIGFDGLWATETGESLVVEVKTTDAYRIDLNTIAGYRKELIRCTRISDELSSILIVVGRQDTGDLEAQIRGSRHAWDIRLISVDALLRLLKVKESVDDPAIAWKIAQILIPREYTRVDGIIDVVFSAAEEDGTEVPEEEDDVAPQDGKKFVPVNFHDACITRLEKALKQSLVKQTRSTYGGPDGRTGLVCSISRRHNVGAGKGYWFAFHPYQRDFLKSRTNAFVAFGCGSADTIIVVPFTDFQPLLEGLNTTNRGDTFYWHVKIQEKANSFILHRKPSFAHTDLTKYRI